MKCAFYYKCCLLVLYVQEQKCVLYVPCMASHSDCSPSGGYHCKLQQRLALISAAGRQTPSRKGFKAERIYGDINNQIFNI